MSATSVALALTLVFSGVSPAATPDGISPDLAPSDLPALELLEPTEMEVDSPEAESGSDADLPGEDESTDALPEGESEPPEGEGAPEEPLAPTDDGEPEEVPPGEDADLDNDLPGEGEAIEAAEEGELPVAGVIADVEEAAPLNLVLSRAAVPDKMEYLMPVQTGKDLGRNGRYGYGTVNPSNWATIRCSSSAADGSQVRITSACTAGKLTTTVLNPKTRTVVSTKTVSTTGDLPIVGGVELMSNGYIYLLTGQNNLAENASATVLRITKYDKNLNRLGSASLTSGQVANHPTIFGVQMPFMAGSPSMALVGGTLYVHMARQMHKAADGLNHQANITLSVNASSLSGMAAHSYSYSSHSFNQFARAYSGATKLLLADHGDAYPRSIFAANMRVPGTGTTTTGTVLPLVGAIGNNYTAATLNGVEVAGNTAGFVGISAPQDKAIQGITGIWANKAGQSASNLYFATFNLDGTAQPGFRWVTNYNPKTSNTIIGQPTLTALPSGQFVVMYQMTTPNTWARTLHYVLLDKNGSTVAQKSFTGFAYLPSSQPVVIGDDLYWVGVPQRASESLASATDHVLMGLSLKDAKNPTLLKRPAVSFATVPTPVISGAAKVGAKLTATKAGKADFKPTADSVSYQWLRNGSAISGATGTTYTPVVGDLNASITVKVTGKRTGYTTGSKTSAAVKVAAGSFTTIPTPVISGAAQVGKTLTATKAGKADFKPAADSVSYQWKRAGVAISGATGSSYKLVAADAGKKITVTVVGKRAGYANGSKTSAAVSVVLPANKPVVSRLAGPSRYGTNDAVNAKFGAKGGPVFVATGADFADALSIGPVVGVTGGSLFLTPRKSIDQVTLNRIKDLKPSAVYIVGGSGAVSDGVVAKVKAASGKSPVRVAGVNRYDTSEAIYKRFFVDGKRAVPSVFVATGRNFPDALSAASAGSALKAPVLLVNGTSAKGLSPYLMSSLKSKKTSLVLISGGTGAVNKTIESNVSRSFSVRRLSGPSRYDTNAAVNNYVASKAGSAALTSVFLATGKDFPDALSAAAPSGKLSSRLVLSNGSCIPKPVVSEWITKPGSKVANVYLVGGTGVLSKQVASLTQCK